MPWHYLTMAMLLAGAAAGVSYSLFPDTPVTKPVANRLGHRVFSAPDLPGVLGQGQINAYASAPAPITTATAQPRHRRPRPAPQPSASQSAPAATAPPSSAAPTAGGGGAGSGAAPLGGASYAGSLVLNATGSELASWNATSSFCPQTSWQVADGKVAADASGAVTLSTSGTPGSCVALISPQAYSSAVIEARVNLPALPGKPGTIADWTSFWLTDGAHWPDNGELDAVEAEPVNGVSAVSWHGGTSSSPFVASTDGFFPTKLPKNCANLTPGWHTVDVVYTKGFFAVYYDGQQYTSYTSDNVTGDPLNIYITTSVTPDIGSIQQQLGGSPVNSDTSPATYAVQDVKVWSLR